MSNMAQQLSRQSKKILSMPKAKSETRRGSTYKLEDQNELISTGGEYEFPFFNPVQSAFYPKRNEDANFVICAATSAGKTVIAELSRNEKGKFLYLSPMKAITEEKKADWSDPKHKWFGLNVSILTGDYKLTPEKVDQLRESDIITLTSEMLDTRTRMIESEKNDWMLDISTLVIDEFHLIGSETRGDKLESALMRFTVQNPKARVVVLSATMHNVEQISTWLSRLNGKDTYVIESKYRPVKLETNYLAYDPHKFYLKNEQSKLDMAIKQVQKLPKDKIIVFVHTKAMGKNITYQLNRLGLKVQYHNADLPLKDKQEIERQFRDKGKNGLRILVSTSTLAWGVNTPADSVVIVGVHRGMNAVETMDIKQMVGRAGRVGLTTNPIGRAFILIPSDSAEAWRTVCERETVITSKFMNDETLSFHVCSEVHLGTIYDAKTFVNWYGRSLANFQGTEMTLEKAEGILQTLTNKRLLTEQNDKYHVTGLGKVSAFMYYSPFDVSDISYNFHTLRNRNIPLNEHTFSWAISKIYSNYSNFYDKKLKEDINTYENYMMHEYGLSFDNNPGSGSGLAFAWALGSASPKERGSLSITKRVLLINWGRYSQVIKMIDSMSGKWGFGQEFDDFSLRIQYDIPKHLIPLVRVKGIGGKYAEKLWKYGIRNAADMKAKSRLVKTALPSAVATRVLASL